jgi:malonate-semialdehyde dehydrogenase (acetylating) / methylmalonate-semialdehyde dehydrogenase
MNDLAVVPMLINGKWETSSSRRFGEVFNPSRGSSIARTPLCGPEEVERVTQAAAEAFPAWAETPVVERARVMFRFRDLLIRHMGELAQIVTLEHGKTRAEASASIQRGIEMVEFACGIPSLIMGQCLQNIAARVDCETIRHPLGVCVGITPFNFPVMVPLWMFPIAITCGNTFILKPSEKVPFSAVRLGELLMEAGLPPGVFNIVHGDRECVETLLDHPRVAAVSFVGSTPVARSIYERGTRQGKRVQAAGGAKNHLIIMPDADLDQAVGAILNSAFGCAGERCMAGSIALPVGNIGEALVPRICRAAEALKVGPTDTAAAVDMGPVITREHRERVARYLDVAREEGTTIVLDGRERRWECDGFLLGPSVVDRVRPGTKLATEEIFGPLLSVVRAETLQDALELGQQCPYGNGASIFTNNGYAAREFKHRFNAGMIGINVGVPAPMAWFPFTGWNQSFFGDLHMQGTEGVSFYTRQKMTMTRWFASTQDLHHDPIWKK